MPTFFFSFTCTVVKWKIKSINQSWLYGHRCNWPISKGTLNVRTYPHRYRTARSCSSNIIRQQFQGVLLNRKSPSSIVGQLQLSVFNYIFKVLLVDTFLLFVGQVLPHGLDLIIQDWVKQTIYFPLSSGIKNSSSGLPLIVSRLQPLIKCVYQCCLTLSSSS